MILGQTDLFNIWTTGAMEKSLSSTSGQAELFAQHFFENPRLGLFVRKLSSVKHSIHKTSYFLYLKPPIITFCKDWEAYYWAPLGECFEQESRGPCQEGQYFSFNLTSRQGPTRDRVKHGGIWRTMHCRLCIGCYGAAASGAGGGGRGLQRDVVYLC
jgi:hypothetical protein